jgi:hypothetical protein
MALTKALLKALLMSLARSVTLMASALPSVSLIV